MNGNDSGETARPGNITATDSTYLAAQRDYVITAARDVTYPVARLFEPPHPAAILHDDVLPALGLSVGDAAAQLGVAPAELSRVLDGQRTITADFALRIEQWLGVDRGGRAELWLTMQLDHDLWNARRRLVQATG